MHTQVELPSHQNDIIVTAVCQEPEGDFVRSVRPLRLTPENLRKFWERAREFPTLFTENINNDFRKFCELFISEEDGKFKTHGLFWVIDDFVGMYYMTDISEIDAQVHYSFFDRRHKGREDLTFAMIKYIFDVYGLRRMSVKIPLYVSKNTFGFTYALGFKKEGRIRKCVQYKGDWFDATIFGILREEVANGRPKV